MKKEIILTALIILPQFLFSQYGYDPGDTIGPFDTITFDQGYEHILIDTSAQNIWQVGPPQKTFFNSAYTAPNAIVTDTLTFYPTNNHSYFDLFLSDINYPGWFGFNMFLDFMHKYDTDSLKDGGYITISYDNGQTWINIIKDSCYYFFVCPPGQSSNLYGEEDSLYNGEIGFSGNSGGWIKTGLAWYWLPVTDEYPDTMILRFNFVSDSLGNGKEGWMIDQIKLYAIDLGGGQEEFNDYNKLVQISPNPFSNYTEIRLDNEYASVEYIIYDNSGRIVKQNEVKRVKSFSIDRQGLDDGLYLIRIRLNDGVFITKKLVLFQ